jgi:molybdopterin/thiamine biosynthesis adenylyltransferase
MSEIELNDEDRARYQWQMWSPDIGEQGQRKLKTARVLISRVGGVGGAVATYLAAAGVGKLVLAHAGNVRIDDLNRQTLMTSDWVGRPRLESAARRLRELNPNVEIECVFENVSLANAVALIDRVDLAVCAAPLFEERLAMNGAAVAARKVMIDCAMYDFDAQITTIVPGESACLACRVPTSPPEWKRQFPVVGAVAGMIGALAAIEAIKRITGVGEGLVGRLLLCDLRQVIFRAVRVRRDPQCAVCSGV